MTSNPTKAQFHSKTTLISHDFKFQNSHPNARPSIIIYASPETKGICPRMQIPNLNENFRSASRREKKKYTRSLIIFTSCTRLSLETREATRIYNFPRREKMKRDRNLARHPREKSRYLPFRINVRSYHVPASCLLYKHRAGEVYCSRMYRARYPIFLSPPPCHFEIIARVARTRS